MGRFSQSLFVCLLDENRDLSVKKAKKSVVNQPFGFFMIDEVVYALNWENMKSITPIASSNILYM